MPEPTGHTLQKRHILLLAGLILLGYANTFLCDWHFDDYPNIVLNTNVHLRRLSFDAIVKTFTDTNRPDKISRPIPMLTFGLNWLAGSEDVRGYHLVNLIVHFINAIFLYLLLERILAVMDSGPRSASGRRTAAFLAAALWAVHPLHTQAVTYIVQRMALLGTLFYLIGLYIFIQIRPAKSRRLLISGIIACAAAWMAAMACKENTATFPLAIALIEVVCFRNKKENNRKSRLLLWIPCGIVLAFTLGIGLFLNGDLSRVLHLYDIRHFSLSERLLTEPRVLIFYLSQILYPLPVRLSIEHDFPLSTSLADPFTTLPSLTAVMLLIFAGFYLIRKSPICSLAILFFFLAHTVESTFIGLELFFEHRNYLPSIFLFVPIAAWAIKRAQSARNGYSTGSKIMCVVIGIWLTLLVSGTYMRNMTWSTGKSLNLDAIAKAPRSGRLLHNLAWVYYEKEGNLKTAMSLYRRSLSLDVHRRGDLARTLMNMGRIYSMWGMYSQAIHYWERALETYPESLKGIRAKAVLLCHLGRWREAGHKVDRLLHVYPDSVEYKDLKALIEFHLSNYSEALKLYRELEQKMPDERNILVMSGLALIRIGAFDEAGGYLTRARNLSPGDPMALLALLELYGRTGDLLHTSQILAEIKQYFPSPGIRFILQRIANDHMFIPVTPDYVVKQLTDLL